VHAWDGGHGDYLTAKVAKVFPELAAGLRISGGSRVRPLDGLEMPPLLHDKPSHDAETSTCNECRAS
jgi:hypothetical protein